MEENINEVHKDTLNNSLKELWQKIMLLCGKQLIKAGTNILAKIGEEEPQKDLTEEVVAPTYQADIPTELQTELQPVGNVNYPHAEDEFIDSPIDTPNEEKAESKNKGTSESDGSPSISDADNTPATDVDSSLSSIKLVHNAANLINEYDRQATEAEDNGFRTLYNDAANRLIENLILAGCTGINPQEDEPFDFNRHATRPFSLPSNQLIKKTIRLGVALNDEVLVKAIVELK